MDHFPYNDAHYKKPFLIQYFNFQSFPLSSRNTVLGILSQGVYNPTTNNVLL